MAAIERITARDARFQRFQTLKTNRNKRRRYGEFFVEGVRNINEAVQTGWEIGAFLYSPQRALSRWAQELLDGAAAPVHCQLPQDLLAELSGKGEPSELLAVVKTRPDDLARLETGKLNPVYVLFDRPSNRGNLGTLLRSMDAFGADGLLLTGHGVDLYDPEVVGASMGSFFRVPAVRVEGNDPLARWIAAQRARYPGFQAIGTTAHRQRPLWGQNLTGPLLLMIGNETDGLAYGLKESCDALCTIPMAQGAGASSFNVSCAATAILYETARQRWAEGEGGPGYGG